MALPDLSVEESSVPLTRLYNAVSPSPRLNVSSSPPRRGLNGLGIVSFYLFAWARLKTFFCRMWTHRKFHILGVTFAVLIATFIFGFKFMVAFFIMMGCFFMLTMAGLVFAFSRSSQQRSDLRRRRMDPRELEQHLQAVGVGPERIRLLMSDRDFDSTDYETLLALDDNSRFSEGLVQQQIDHLGSFHVIEGFSKKCAICLDRAEPGDEVRALPCLHQFHIACIDKWLAMKAECPLCNFPAITNVPM